MTKLTEAQEDMLRGNIPTWADMTNENEHSEVRCRISHFLNIVTQGKAYMLARFYSELKEEHDRLGYMSKMMMNLREALDHEMHAFITEELGEEVCQRIWKCL